LYNENKHVFSMRRCIKGWGKGQHKHLALGFTTTTAVNS